MPVHSPENGNFPELTTQICTGLILKTPVLAVAGTFGYGDELAELADTAQLGALISPTLTLLPRHGNPPPRTAEASAGLLHSTGLPNPGLEAFLTKLLPELHTPHCPLILSILGETPHEWATLAKAVAASGKLAALELNLSPLEWQSAERTRAEPATEAELLEEISNAVRTVRESCALPLIAKLPALGADIGRAARSAVEAGADVISVSHAFPGIAVRPGGRAFRFHGVVGGLSGPCIKPMALYQVWRVAQATQTPILGVGGIMTGEDALEFFFAGATAVGVGMANLIHPGAIAQITAEIGTHMHKHAIHKTTDLIGSEIFSR